MRHFFSILTVAFCATTLIACKASLDDNEAGTMGLSTDGSSLSFLNQKPVLVVTGLTVEATIAASFGTKSVSSGGNPAQLQTLLSKYNSSNIRGVVSFGTAGGLDPSLQPGDVVVMSSVTEGGVTWNANSALTAAIVDKIFKQAAGSFAVHQGPGASSSTSILDAAGKTTLWNSTHTEVVDMESEIAAAFAAQNGLPFVAVRAVADPYNQSQPPASLVALMPDGSLNLSAIINSIATSPSQIPDLWNVALQTEAAFSSLTTVREAVDFGEVFP